MNCAANLTAQFIFSTAFCRFDADGQNELAANLSHSASISSRLAITESHSFEILAMPYRTPPGHRHSSRRVGVLSILTASILPNSNLLCYYETGKGRILLLCFKRDDPPCSTSGISTLRFSWRLPGH